MINYSDIKFGIVKYYSQMFFFTKKEERSHFHKFNLVFFLHNVLS